MLCGDIQYNKLHLDENVEKLIKKCGDKETDTSVMGAFKVLLEEIDQGEAEFSDEKYDESYIEMAQTIKPQDVPKVIIMTFKIK